MHPRNDLNVRLNAIRLLWQEWDPIGVFQIGEGDWPADEYDAYLGPCLSLLDQGSSKGELAGYLTRIIGDHMGLGEAGIAYSKPEEFAKKLRSWHESYQGSSA